jgi:hypothetical protein
MKFVFDIKGMTWQEAGENCIVKSFIICTLHKILLGSIKKDEMSNMCSMHGRDEKYIQHFGQKT